MRDFSGDFEWDDDMPLALTYSRLSITGGWVRETVTVTKDQISMSPEGITYMPGSGATIIFLPWARIQDITQTRKQWS